MNDHQLTSGRGRKLLALLFFAVVITSFCSLPVLSFDSSKINAYYSMDDADVSGTVLVDSVNEGQHNASINGTVTSDTGKLGQARHFDGTSGFIDLNVGTAKPFTMYSVSFWVKLDNNWGVRSEKIIGYRVDSNDRAFFDNMNTGNARIYIQVNGGTSSYEGSPATLGLIDKTWQHVVINSGGGNSKLYVDGKNTYNFTENLQNYTAGEGFRIGADADSDAQFLDGMIDEVLISNISLTEAEILELYNSGSGYNPLKPNLSISSVSINSPPTGTNYSLETSSSIEINYTGVASPETANCSIYIDSVLDQTENDVNLTSGGNFSIDLSGEDGDVVIVVDCVHVAGNKNDSITLWVDNVIPVIDIINPLEGENFDTDFNIDATCTDSNLYRANITGYDQNGSVVFSNETSGIVGNAWVFAGSGTFSDWSNSPNSHHIDVVCTDSHTTTDLLKDWSPEKTRIDKVEFFDGDLSIELLTAVDKFDVIKEKDRYSFVIAPKTLTSQMVYKISGDWVEVDSEFPCHLIDLGRGLWFDASDDGVSGCDVDIQEGYAVATSYYSKPKGELLVKSVGELNVVTLQRNFTTFVNTTTADFTGVTCGERYPDNQLSLNFSGQGFTSCLLHINDRLYEDWDSACGIINVSTEIGRNVIRINALNAFNNSIEDTCTVWTDKADKEVGDYLGLLIMFGVWGFMIVMGFRLPIVGVLASLFGFFIAYELLIISAVLCIVFAFMQLVILFGMISLGRS